MLRSSQNRSPSLRYPSTPLQKNQHPCRDMFVLRSMAQPSICQKPLRFSLFWPGRTSDFLPHTRGIKKGVLMFSRIQKGFKALFCRKTKIPFGHLFWAIRFGFRGPARPYLRFLACNSDFCPVTLIFGRKSESFCRISAPNHFYGVLQ